MDLAASFQGQRQSISGGRPLSSTEIVLEQQREEGGEGWRPFPGTPSKLLISSYCSD